MALCKIYFDAQKGQQSRVEEEYNIAATAEMKLEVSR